MVNCERFRYREMKLGDRVTVRVLRSVPWWVGPEGSGKGDAADISKV